MELSFQLTCFCLAAILFILKPPWLVSADNMYVLKTPGDNQHSKMWLTTESSIIRFKFQACTDLKVVLSRDPQVTDSNVYEIIVGGWGNSQSVIRRGVNGQTMVTVSTPSVLSCDEARPFWIGWQNGNITVGKGNVTGEQSFMNYADPQPYVVVAVSLASGYGGAGNGTYYFYQDETRMAIATTPASYSYNTLWLLQSQKSYVKFGVKACNDALVALCAQMDTSTFTYEVVIGGYNNTQSDIRPGYYQPPSISASTPGILSCTETRYFWVSYEGGLIEVGQGLDLGQRRFLHWKYENPHTVTAIGFSGWDVEDEWEFSHTEDAAMLLRTQSDNPAESNWIDIAGKTLFMFRLKACSFGKIELRSSHENLTSTPDYQIIIGGMAKRQGRRGKPDLTASGFDNIEISYLDYSNVTVSTNFEVYDLLSCDVFRRFWLSWKNQKIELGRNNPHTNILATVYDPVYYRTLKTLHLGTGDLLHQQEWEFVMNTVLVTAVKTSSVAGDSFKSNWVTVRDKQSFVFRVKGCYDARIILASYTKVVDVSSYEIVIGTSGNQVSKIGKDGLDGGNVVEASTPNVLHCKETRYFWVSWGGGFYQVGSGAVPGENGFLQLQDSSPYKIRSLAFDSDSPTVAIWEFGAVTGQLYVVQTPADDFAGLRYFRLATHKQSFAFEVVACKDAIISLSNGTHHLAEVVIGAEENTKSIIKSLAGEPIHVEKSTIGILNCFAKREFWIQFLYDTVKFGQGSINEVVILEAYFGYMLVEALSISTKGVRGIWTFSQQSGKFVETETPNAYGYNYTWITVDDRKAMVFKVKACNDAHIALSSQLGITYIHTYEIVLGAYGNMESLIRNTTQGNPWVIHSTPGIVNCTELRTFWVGWDSGLIRVGRGGEIGMDQFMHWQDPNPYAVHGLGICSGFEAVATWQFSYIQESTYIAETTSWTSYYSGVNLIVAEKTYFEFRVQVCSGAGLALYGEYFSWLMYVVGIGVDYNTMLMIYDAKLGIEVQNLAYPDLLSCWVERPFWISWKNGVVKLGQGFYPQSQLLEYVDEAPQPVNTITLYNSDYYYSDAIWEFSTKQVYQLNAWSRTLGYYDTLTLASSSRPFLVFSVMACSEISLVMSELLGLTNVRSYKVLIGFGPEQDQLEIHKDNERKIHRHLSCVLHCTQYREFWISWENGLIAFGYGSEVGTNVYLHWQDSHPLPISAVAVSSYSDSTDFQLRTQEGESYFVTTPPGLTEVHTWLIMQRHEHTFMFDAMSCHEISVILAGELGVIHHKAYEIMFGVEENTIIEIRKPISGSFQTVYQAAAYGILNCNNYQSLWLSWRDGVISAGYGVPYQFTLITWKEEEEEFIQVQGLTLGYRAPDPISWKIRKDQSLQLLVSSLKDNSYLRNWMTTRYGRHMSFAVRACGNVAIYLSKQMHITTGADVYIVELGLTADSHSYIRELNVGTILTSAHTPGILSCTLYRSFWIGWFRNGIEVGHGGDIGYSVFLRWDSGLSHVVRAVGVSTFGSESGNFRLPETQGNYHLVLTKSDDANFSRVSFKLANREYIYLRIRACYGARIRLDGPGYLVEIGTNENERIVIRSANETIQKSVDSPGILSCKHLRFYWVSWFNGTVEMGNEAPLGNVLISWTDPAPVPVTGFSLATELGAEGEWQAEQHPELELTVKTPDQWDRYHLWTSVVGREYITFQVAACHDAHLALSFIPLYPEMHSYQIIIGGWDNSKSAIRDEINYGTSTKVEVSTPGILDCTEKRDFWVGWRNMTIQVGTGAVPFQYVFMQWRDDYFYEVEAVGFSTGHGSIGEWTLKTADQLTTPTGGPVTPSTSPIPTQPGEDLSEDNTYTIYTNSTNEFDHFVLTTDQNAFLFTVNACRDVYLFLTHLPGVTDYEAYRITLGVDENTRSSIYKTPPNENTFDVSTNIFTCYLESLWVTWADGTISVGEGSDVNQGQLFTWTDTQPYAVNALAMASKDVNTVTWTFRRESGRVLNASTETQYSYNQIWFSTLSMDSAVVNIRTCHDAHILLSETNGMSPNTYEVAFGINGNTESVMREGPYGPNIVWIDTPGILSCDELRYFWFRWKDQRLEVGTGSTVGKNFLMEHVKENHPETIKSIAVSSGWEAAGRWEISNVQGQAYTLYTYPSSTQHENWFYTVGKSFTFQLQECQSAKVILAQTPLHPSTPGFVVTLGDVSSISRLPDTALTSVDTPQLLHCYSLRTFWITWTDGIKVGKGRINYNQFMEYQETSPPVVAAVVLQSPNPSTGAQWQILRSTVGNSVFTTPSSGTVRYLNLWHSMAEQKYVIFKIRACSDARILLADYFAISDYQVYDVWLGKHNNTYSILTDGIDGILMDEASTHNILHCRTAKWFWIDWTKGLGIGSGPKVGDQLILNISPGTLPRPLRITSVSYDTGPNQHGEWEFSSMPAQYFTVQTPGTYSHNHTWLIVHSVVITFKVRACEEARILLTENPYNLATYSREVIIGGWNNTRSAIIKHGDNSTLTEKETKTILQCHELQDFWIGWNKQNGGRISVGKGVLGSGEFLTHKDPDFGHIYGVSISTGNGYTGEWQFPTTIARVFQFNTTTTYAYDQFYLHLANQSSATFMVQTCNDAHIGLFDYFLAEKAYEIVIGGSGNQKSFIRRTRLQENQVAVDTPNIVNCQQMLPFWVGWFSGHIKVGRGSIVDEQIFMDWLDPEPLTVTFFSITTGWGATGLWQFSNIEANAVIVNTPNNEGYADHYLDFKASQTFLNFVIQSCHSAHLSLSQSRFAPTLYKVIIGHDSNTKSQIIRYAMNESGINQGTVVAEELSPGILDCSQQRPFWLSWQGGKIEVAMESASGQRFLDWMDSEPHQVSALSLATGPESRGEWKYSIKEVTSIEQVTAEQDDRYGLFLLSVKDKSEATFSVTACKDAHVILSQIPGIFKYLSYELLIGTAENTETVLKKSDTGYVLAFAITPGILNCQMHQFFWISWTIGSISFGKGTVPEQNRVLYYMESPGHTLNSLSIRTPIGVKGVWGFAGISGDIYELHTPDDGSNHKYSYNAITTWQEVLTFVVKACNDAHIALQSVPGSSEDKLFEIVIGGYVNTRSEIRDGKSGPMLSFHEEFGILSCLEYRPFWIRWRGGLVEVGKGNLDTHRMMSYQLTGSQNVSIAALSTTTGYGSQGDWVVYESDVSSLRVTTLPERNYNQLSKSITTPDSIVFRVQACRDAHVALSVFFNNVQTRTYEIIIGGNGNQNSFIRDYETMIEKQRVETPNIVDCNNYKAFWVKMESSGRITVGKGAVFGSSTFLDWMDDENRIFKGLTVSTWDGATGFWDFSFLQGDTYSIFTQANYSYNYAWLWPMYNYLTFKVKSCNDAHILLSSAVQDLSSNAYEIVLGGSENTISAIRRGSLGANVVQESTPNIMNCDTFLPFWVRWQNKTLEVGSGPVDSHVLMRLDDPEMPTISVASMTSWYSAPGEYQFLQTEVSLVRVNSTTPQSFWTLHKSTIDVQEVKFKVKSSSDAMLALLSVPSNLNAPSYEITVGAQGNTLSILKSKSPMGDLVIQVDTPGILDPGVFQSFWISWVNGTVNFGSGDVVGQSRLLSFIDPQPTYRKHVHSIAVASGAGSFGEWEFEQTNVAGTSTTSGSGVSSTLATIPPSITPLGSDDTVTVYTDVTQTPDHVVVTTQRKYFVVNLDACKEAHVYLTHIPGVFDNTAYQISIGTSSNTKSSIHKMPPNEQTLEYDTANILPCTVSQPMWVKWDQGEIMVGSGPTVGQDIKFQWKDEQPYAINAFSLASKDDKAVNWTMLRDYGRIFNVSTIKDYTYYQVWVTTYYVDNIVLHIKGCRDAHILLSESFGMGDNTYEVAFGIINNTKSVIREGPYGENVVSVETPGIMNCTEFKYFWFRWKDKLLEVGTGSVVGVNKLMEHAKPNHPERILSVAMSTGWEETGRYEISNVEGAAYSLHTDEISTVSERRNWFYPVGKYFEFQLRTCENAQIRLAEIPKRETTNGYDIGLSNAVSSVIKISDIGNQVAKDTPLLLDCTVLRKFWITWSQGVKVGTGKLNSEVLLDLQDSSPVAIAAIAITTPAASAGGGEWQVKRDTVKSTVFYTPAVYQYKYAWHTTVEEKSLSFKVRACSDVSVILTKFFGITDYGVYEIVIGSQGNTKVEIRFGVGGTLIAEQSTSDLLHCTQSRWFWIDWTKGVSVGSGPYISDSALLSVSASQMPEQFPIYAAAFSTGTSSDGDWEFTTVPAEQFTFVTPSQYSRNTAWMLVQRNFFTFQVRACSEARVVLAYDPRDLSVNAKEVVIGGWSNTKSAVYSDLTSNQTAAQVDTNNILNCDSFNEFWIQWYSTGIDVGKGSLNTQLFLHYTDMSLHHIHAVSISTGDGSSGEWQLSVQAAIIYQLYTSNIYTYSKYFYRVGAKTYVAFKVQACNDAHVALFDEYMLDLAYEIVIGGSGNTYSVIRRTRLQENKVQVSTPQILNCSVVLPFWVSWSYGVIKVGKGNLVDEQLFMQWQDPDPLAVSIVSITTGWEATGVWEFTSIESGTLKLHLTAEQPVGHWIKLKSSEQFFTFSVRACDNVQISVCSLPSRVPVYEIVLGGNNNTRSGIFRYDFDVIVLAAQEDTPAILDCAESRSFYVSWANGEIEVAIGSATGRRFLEWKDDNPQQLFLLSLASMSPSVIEWDYAYKTAQVIYHQTGGAVGDYYGRIMLSVVGYTEFVFGVQACSDAFLALSQVPGLTRHLTYELEIGIKNNSETVLRNSVGGPIMKSAQTPQILNCDSMPVFWVTWRNGQISFGKGPVPDQGAVFTVNDPQWHPISSVSFLTPTGVTGLWMTSMASDNVYELQTPDDGQDYKYVYNLITTSSHTLIFQVKACNDAHILLQSIPGSMDDQAFEIVLGGWGNTRSVIRDNKGGNELAVSEMPMHLDCDSYRQFWVTWRNNTVEVGKDFPYTQSFLFHQMTNPEKTPVCALTFTTGFGSRGDWFVYETDVTSVRVTTLPEHNYNQMSKSVLSQNSVVFRVQACRDAHLALSEVFNNVQIRTYEIIIGGYGNTQSFIRDYDTGTEVLKLDTPNIMDCNNSKAFWAKWETSGRITVGQGAVIGNSVFLDWVDTEKRIFHGITISTWDGASGYWDFSYLQGDVYTVFTEANYGYNYTWLLPMYNYITFKVKSCKDAHILLSTAIQDVSNTAYEIVIGGSENTISAIRRGSLGQNVVQESTPNIMNCDTLLPFWVRWQNKILEVGSGPLDSHILMRLDDPEMPAISVASVTSWYSAPGEYQFLQTEVSSIKVNSTNSQSYRTLHHSTMNAQQIKFKVKSSNDAILSLLSVSGNFKAPSYEITLGTNGNMISKLKAKSSNGEFAVQVDTPSILSASEYRPFWISWINGEVQFGTGDVVGQNRLLNFIDPLPTYRKDVHSVAVTSGVGASGEWEFVQQFSGGSTTPQPSGSPPPSVIPPTDSDDVYAVFTDHTKATDYVVVTTQRKSLAFNLNACKEAYIYLTYVPGVVDNTAYKVSIGTSSNTKSSIQKLPPDEQNQEFDTPNILSCTSSWMWISWENGVIMVGSGSIMGQDVKFQWTDEQPFSVNAFSLGSNDGKAVIWTFLRDYGRIFNVSTALDYSYEQAWLSTYYVDHVILSVMGCRDAHILLSESSGMGNNSYEAALGILDNTRSVIREGAYGANIVSVETPGIMVCNESKYFWFHWKDQRLQVGTGSVVGVNKIMEHAKPNHPERILSVGLSTGWDAIGRWQVSNIEDVSYSMFTDEISNVSDRRVWFYPVSSSFEFQLRTCENAQIRLAEIPKQETTNGYDISLSNTLTSILKIKDAGNQITKDTPQLLDCTVLRKFWITWSQGIKVGTGKLNSVVLLELQDSSSVRIAAISVTTPTISVGGGEWQVKRDTVKSTLFYTPASFQYKYAWYTTMEEKSVLFKVRACSDAYVLLAKFFGITAFGVYEVLIGGQGNSKLEIRYGVGGTLLAEQQITDLLHCSQSRWFWVDWSNGIYVGSGQYISDSALLSVSKSQMPEQFPIYATAFSTGTSSNGDWEFTTVPAEQFTFVTPSLYGHNHAWMIMELKSLSFQVRACSEARILLAYDPYDLTSNVKEVVIGGWSNTKSAIYGDLISNQTVAMVDTNNILNCDVFKDFWVQWHSAGIAVGEGTPFSSEFMRYDDSNIHKINALSFSTGEGSSGEWQVGSQAALIYQLHTTTEYTYSTNWYRVGKKSFVAFQVQACNDAHVGLFDEYMVDMAYEIVLGGSANTISAIRRTRLQDNKVQISTSGILNCNQAQPFWVSWSYGIIKVGKGDLVDEKLFMQWQDPEPLAVSIVSVSTGWGSTGVWRFSGFEGGFLQLHTTPEHPTGHWVQLKSSQQSFSFSVSACGHARILLARVPYEDAIYEVVLAANNNTQSQILRYQGEEMVIVAQEDTPGIIACSESRSFYLSWANGEIEVAIGSATGRRFLEWKDDNPQSIFAVSLACGSWYQELWEYSYLSVLGLAHQTGGESADSYSRIVMSVVGSNEFVFGVAACRDAYIAMSQVAGIYTHFTYELVIGAQDNTETMLRSSVGGNLLKSVMTPQILSCDTVRIFWLTWKDGRISFGKGLVPEQGALFSVTDGQWHSINSLSFMTPAGVTGYFTVPTFVGNWWELHTPDDGQDYKYVYNIITTINDTLIFLVEACNDAHLLLQSVPGSMEDQCFEIVIGGWNNTRSVIRDKIQGNELATSTEPSLLNCGLYMQFWVTWRSGTIQVGRNYPYLQSFLSYQMPNPDSTPVNAITFTSGFGSEADWVVFESDVTSVRVTTLPQRNYNQLSKSVMSQNSVVFRVQACKDAHLALSELVNNVQTRTYEIVIGGNGNTQSFIRDYATMLEGQRVDTPNIMDCNNYKAFWVKWEKNGSGRIMAGEGAVIGNAVFIDWVDSEKRNFQGFTISTYDNAPGLWDFSFLQGNMYSLFTDAVYKYDYSWFRPASNYLTFNVRTCDNAHLLLSSEMLEYTENAYEIVLGAYSNMKSDIRRGAQGPALLQVDTPNIMNCDEYLPFWVRWENKTLQIGTGAIDETVLMRLDDSEMPEINAASVTSWSSANGEYQFPETQVKLLSVNSLVEQGYRTAHRSLLDQTQLVFKVRVQSDAKLALLIVPGNYKTSSYEFEIGINGNTKSRLLIKSSIGDIVTEVETPSILSENELRPFWISWHNATIRFGTGESVGQGQLLSHTDPQPAYRRHVHSVAVATGAAVNGEWEFKGTLDDGNGGTTTTVVYSSTTTPLASTTVTETTTTTVVSNAPSSHPSSASTPHSTTHSSTKPTTTRYTSASSTTMTPQMLSTILSNSGGSSGGLDPGAVAGIVIGCLAGLLVIALIIIYVVKKYRKKAQEESQQIHFDNPAYYGNVVEMKPTSSTDA